MLNSKRRLVYQTSKKSSGNKYIPRPQIRLEGKWLEELGFERGRSFRIITEHGRIVIELEDSPSNRLNR